MTTTGKHHAPADWSRRSFIAAAGATGLGFLGLRRLLAAPDETLAVGYGPLVPDPAGILDLPQGFSYKVIARIGEQMADGLVVPGRPDGMAAFAGPDGKTLVVCNHEVDTGDFGSSPFGSGGVLESRVRRERIYDVGDKTGPRMGGTTTIVYDTASQTKDRQFMSLAGTLRNCAGGPTPWGSWLTCEETVARAGQAGNQRDHGWVFEVPATAEVGLADPQPIKAMGRFNHEAVAVDPRTGVIYLTEDRGDGLVYRFIPTKPGDLLKGGRLEALAVRGEPGFDTRNWKRTAIRPGEAVEVEWIPMDGTDAPEDDLRFRGVGAGAAPFARGEGIAWGDDAAYIVCTSGGAKRRGQVFRYRPSEHEGTPAEVDHPGTLSLFIEPEDADVVDMPDNVCVAPWG
ncbi:MAG: alkaline phosphatase PhoX, partial [Phycisphaerales bacterium]